MTSTAPRRAAPWTALTPCIAIAVFQLCAWAQEPGAQPAAALAPILDGKPLQGLPGTVPGTERWVVHFTKRGFDLSEFRRAVMSKRSAAEVARIVAGLEAQVVADQGAFVAAAGALGGRIVTQWWIVNAAAVEIAPARLAELRALPNIAFVEPDVEVLPCILTSTNASNHDADSLQAQGHGGLGVAVGIMDTGQDSNMNGTGRPHRMYFVNGDPGNVTGGGIGGSRLVVNRQIGAIFADDQFGHGTAVASVACGADWGTAAADDGHAPLAQIAGYSIANSTQGGTSSAATMAAAWQAMAADRVAFNIVAANLSYTGWPNPLDVSQQALDSAALNADILVCVAAGNTGFAGTSYSQSAANGLAVAAVNPTSHTVASFSTRGPLWGDTARFYPDIAACGVNMEMALRNDESGNYNSSATSFSSPQVAGAATQLRGRFTALTALETKAILLASTSDISTQNPTLDRNSFGMGFLFNPRAHAIASSCGFGSGTLSAGTSVHTFTIPAVPGGSYAIAIAWHRQDTTTTNWSNLDLEILDAAGLPLASSTTTRNLYEMVRFNNPAPGLLTVRTTGVSLSAPSQPFSWAWTDHTAVPFPGSAVSYGQGCPGSALTPGGQCASINPNGGGLENLVSQYEFAYDLSSATPLGVTAFEIYTRATSGVQTVSAALYGAPGTGAPSTTPLAMTSVRIGSITGFYRGTFAGTVNVPAGQFWIGVDHSAQTTRLSQIVAGASAGAFYRTSGSGGSWTRSTQITRPSLRVLCQTVPAIAASAPPEIGLSFALNLSLGAAGAPAFLGIGFSDQSWNGVPLPFSFAPLGASGCSLLSSIDASIGLGLNAQGSAVQNIYVPCQALFVGGRFFAQGLIIDPPANAFGLVSTNGLRLTIGN